MMLIPPLTEVNLFRSPRDKNKNKMTVHEERKKKNPGKKTSKNFSKLLMLKSKSPDINLNPASLSLKATSLSTWSVCTYKVTYMQF